MKILIVDDHELHRKVLGARLRKHGHTTIEACDGLEALEVLKKGKIQAVVSDVLMPRMDGYELCWEIRKSPKIAHTAFILYSAVYTTPEDEKTARASGVDRFFKKPIPEHELLQALEEVIAIRTKARPSAKRSSRKRKVLKEYSARLVEKLEESVAEGKSKAAELERSERRFRTLVRTVSAAVLIYQTDRILFANSVARDLTGYSETELLKMKPLDLIHPDDRDLAKRKLFMGSGFIETTSRIELRMTTHSGAVRWLDFSASLIDYDGIKAVAGTGFDITARKTAEDGLRASEDRYRELVENSLGLICIHDLEGTLLLVNPAASKELGYEPVEMVGRSMRDFMDPSVTNLFDAYLERITRLGTDQGLVRVLARDGSAHTWLYQNILSGTGEPYYVLGHAVDVTAQKELEGKLKESEERLRTIIATEPECVKTVSKDGIILAMNPAGISMIEADDESMVIGKPVFAIITPEYHDSFRKLLEEVFAGKNGRVDFEIIGFKGTRRWLEMHAVPLHDKRNKIVAMLSVTRDMTERKRAEDRIREQAALLDIDPAAICVTAIDDTVLFWNTSAERIFGWKKEEMVVSKITQVFPGDLSEKFRKAKEAVLAKGTWKGEWALKRRDGQEIIIESDWTLVKDPKGDPKFLYMVNSDITEKKKLEAQLLRAQRMESLGMVSGGIAHELNNVLSPILLAQQIIRKQTREEKIIKLLDLIETSANRGSTMVTQVLGFARGGEGQRTTIHFQYFIREFQQFIKQTFPKSIEVKTKVPVDLWSFSANATKLQQVLMNLCVNAMDAMPRGGTLTIRAENLLLDANYAVLSPHLNPGPFVVLTVTDTGNGIPPSIINRVFEPFFTTKDVGKGTGLGLSVVAGIIQNYKGFVNVHSEVGKGTSFKIYLPAVETPEVEEAKRKSEELVPGNGETILIVEDDPTVQLITRETLESYGYKTFTASDGAEGVSLYAGKKEQIDLVLCDISMPVMDGRMAIRALKEINHEVKIVVVSGFSDSAKALEEFGDTVQSFLSKPFSAGKLLGAIHDALRC